MYVTEIKYITALIKRMRENNNLDFSFILCEEKHSGVHVYVIVLESVLHKVFSSVHTNLSIYFVSSCLLMYCFLQGGEGVRRSFLLEDNKHITYYYPDALTMYEMFLRGLRESSEFYSCVASI